MLGLRQIPFDFGQGRGNRRRQPFFHAIVESSPRVWASNVIVLSLTGYKLGPTPFRKHNSECLDGMPPSCEINSSRAATIFDRSTDMFRPASAQKAV